MWLTIQEQHKFYRWTIAIFITRKHRQSGALDTPVTLTFDLRVSACGGAAMDVVCLPTLVLMAQAVFLLERGQTERQTDRQTDKQTNIRDWMPYPTPAAIQPVWVNFFQDKCCERLGNVCVPFASNMHMLYDTQLSLITFRVVV